MKVLTITGDKSFKTGNPRFDLQAEVMEAFEALYWGPGALWASPEGNMFDVVTTQDPFFRGLVGLFLAKRFGARLNVQVHADLRAQSFIKRALARFVLRRADSIRVVSEKLKKQVERMGVPAPIFVLPIFVDVAPYRGLVHKSQPKKTIVWLGRFEEEKNPLRAIDVLKEVREGGVDAELIMLGEGSLRQKLFEKAAGLSVQFPGWQANLVPFFEMADVVLSTSRAESWGASIVEALAAGVPVVAPDVGIAREAGALVVPKKDLTKAVLEVLENPPQAILNIPLYSKEEWVAAWKQSL